MPLAIAQEQVVQRIAKTPQHATWTFGMAQTLKGNVGNFWGKVILSLKQTHLIFWPEIGCQGNGDVVSLAKM